MLRLLSKGAEHTINPLVLVTGWVEEVPWQCHIERLRSWVIFFHWIFFFLSVSLRGAGPCVRCGGHSVHVRIP